jgi:hypothetical protein
LVTEFQKAAAAARRRYGDDAWFALTVNEQAKAIYAELRRIDGKRVTALLRRGDRAAPTKLRGRRTIAEGWTSAAEV